MSSLLGTPLQVINVTVEMLFVLENRLREAAMKDPACEVSCEEIFEYVSRKLFHVIGTLFSPRKLFSIEEQTQIFQSCFNHKMLRMSTSSFETLFRISLMAVKVQIVRCNRLSDLVSVTEDKIRELRALLKSEKMREEVTRLKDIFTVFYSSVSIGEMARVRSTLLNSCRDVNYPVAALVAEGYQIDSGQLTFCSYGPNSANLGAAVVYGASNSVVDEYVLPIAGKTDTDSNPYMGPWNMYSPEKQRAKKELRPFRYDEDYITSQPSGPRVNAEGTEFQGGRVVGNIARDAASILFQSSGVASPVGLFNQSNLSYAERLQANKERR